MDLIDLIGKAKARTLTAQEEITAIEQNTQQKQDLFYAQQQLLDTLDNIWRQRSTGTEGTVYVEPVQVPLQSDAPNYMLYAGIGAAVLFAIMFFRKKR